MTNQLAQQNIQIVALFEKRAMDIFAPEQHKDYNNPPAVPGRANEEKWI